MITTPNGIMIPIVFKSGLPYIEHYYPTDAQIRDITREETITSLGEWNYSLLDDSPNAPEQRLGHFPPTTVDALSNFYNMKGYIIVQKGDIDDNSILIDASSTSSGNRRWSYQTRTEKEKQKKHYGPKGKKIKWWDDWKNLISQYTHHPDLQPYILTL